MLPCVQDLAEYDNNDLKALTDEVAEAQDLSDAMRGDEDIANEAAALAALHAACAAERDRLSARVTVSVNSTTQDREDGLADRTGAPDML